LPFVSGFLRATGRGQIDNTLPDSGGNVDNSLPGHGHIDQDLPWGSGRPDNSLPPGVPPIGGTLPEPPPGTWPPPSFSRPIVPANPIAPGAGHKPVDPAAPPVATQPPMQGQLPSAGGPPPGMIWPPIGHVPSQRFWVVAGIPGVGWRYICVDPSLTVDAGLPETPEVAPKK
jgi:hypothetical protein